MEQGSIAGDSSLTLLTTRRQETFLSPVGAAFFLSFIRIPNKLLDLTRPEKKTELVQGLMNGKQAMVFDADWGHCYALTYHDNAFWRMDPLRGWSQISDIGPTCQALIMDPAFDRHG
jgi:hypothetical protein